MATQKNWGYDEALADYSRTGRLLKAVGFGESNPLGRSWNDILRDNAYQLYGDSAYGMSEDELMRSARSNGILGGKELSFGEQAMEGLTGPLAIPAAYLTAGALTGAFEGLGTAGASAGASTAATGGSAAGGGLAADSSAALLAGGGEVGSGYAAAAPGVASSGGAMSFSMKDILGAAKDYAPLIGGILGGVSSNKPAGNITTTEDIPEWLKPYASMGMLGLEDAYLSNPTGESPLTASGSDYMMDVIGGDYLTNNPYLDSVYNQAAGKVTAGVNANFSKAGRYGSGAHQGVLAENLGNLATNIYAGNYNQERARQQQAGLMAPSTGADILNQRFLPASTLLSGVGKIRGGTSSSPYFENKMASILGGALGAKQLFA